MAPGEIEKINPERERQADALENTGKTGVLENNEAEVIENIEKK